MWVHMYTSIKKHGRDIEDFDISFLKKLKTEKTEKNDNTMIPCYAIPSMHFTTLTLSIDQNRDLEEKKRKHDIRTKKI